MATVSKTHDCEWRSQAEDLRGENASLHERLGTLEQQLEALQRHVFGKRSEKVTPVAEEVRRTKAPPPRDETLAKRRANREAREELPTEEIHHAVAPEKRQCPSCGSRDLKPLGEGKRTTLYDYVPAQLVRRVHVQETLACSCGSGVITADGAPKVVEKGHYGAGLLAHVVTAKCADSIPVHRQAKAFRRAGVPLNRTTLGDLFHATAGVAAPLSNRVLHHIAQQKVVNADETPMRVLDDGKTRRGYLWTFRTDELIGFRFSATRSGETPRSVLGGSKGYLVVDGYTGYNAVTVPEGRTRVACWAHARRKFFEAKQQAPQADEVLALILKLYQLEDAVRGAKIAGTAEHLDARTKMSGPVVAAIGAWLAREKPNHTPKSALGIAIRYAQGQWEPLTRFLEDADLPLDNNASERALRTAALGRKNYLFVGHDEAGENIAGLYSLVATCEANGVDPQAYLTDVLPRLSTHPQSRIDELLPHRWAPPVDSS